MPWSPHGTFLFAGTRCRRRALRTKKGSHYEAPNPGARVAPGAGKSQAMLRRQAAEEEPAAAALRLQISHGKYFERGNTYQIRFLLRKGRMGNGLVDPFLI